MPIWLTMVTLRPEGKTARACLFLFLWIGVILTFYALSTTQEYYTFPALAAFALLLGKALADLEAAPTSSTRSAWWP